MDFELLEDFLAVVEHGSILAAAEATGTSQPTLSRRIRELEDSLGVLLLNRSARGSSLTVYGVTFKEHAESLLRGHRAALDQLTSLKRGTHGHARIGLAPALAGYLPVAINKLHVERPEATFEVQEGTYDALVQKTLKGEIDGALTMLPPGESSELLAVRSIGSERLLVIAAPHHPLGNVADIRVKTLENESWILMNRPHSIIGSFYELASEKGMSSSQVSIETSSLDFLKSMVKSSQLLTVLPRGAVQIDLEDGSLISLDTEDLPLVETVFLHRHGVLAPLVTQLVQETQKVMHALQISDDSLSTK